MSDKSVYPPDPIPFDDYYEWLKEFVASEDAQREVARYNAAMDRWAKETGAPRSQAVGEDNEADRALFNYRQIGDRILEQNGWPTRGDINFKRLGPVNNHGAPIIFGDRNIKSEMMMFSDIGEGIITGGWLEHFPDFRADINDKENVREFLRLILTIPYLVSDLRVDLGKGHD